MKGGDVVNEIEGTLSHYMTDHIDHDCKTLDSTGTIHVMGQMAAFTPAMRVIHRISQRKVTMNDLNKIGFVKIVQQTLNPKKILSQFLTQPYRITATMITMVAWI